MRKHLSAIKGGRLAAAAAPARVVTLAISDVPGDDPAVIGSGPTVPDATTYAQAREIIARYGVAPPPAAAARLAAGDDETPKPGSLPGAEFRMIATPMMALRCGGGDRARTRPDAVGAGRRAGRRGARDGHGAWPASPAACSAHGEPLAAPAVLLSGGETTVTLGRGPAGHGGRNTEFLLGLGVALDGVPGIWGMAGDTDGMDGMDEVAGAMLTPDTLARARAKGLDPRAMLAGHDSHSLFDAVGDLIRTGPTLTNVNDIRAILIG